MQKRKSILLVTVDCLRADHVGFMGYAKPTTPFLDSLALESFVFPAAIVAGAPTYYSFPALMASRYPLALGRDVLGVAPSEATLASVLKDSGYSTAFFGAANPYVSARFGYDRGFDTFLDFLSEPSVPVNGGTRQSRPAATLTSRLNRFLQRTNSELLKAVYSELYFRYCQRVTPAPNSLDELRRFPAADVIVDHACEWLGQIGDSPFLLWLHLMDPHGPYYPKSEALDLMQSKASANRARYVNSSWNRSDIGPKRRMGHREEVLDLYDAGIRWVDLQMERLIGVLKQRALWDDCIFAITADHGEEFLEHGGVFHPPSNLAEELIHVPLLLRLPGYEKKILPQTPFSMIHLAPTLLDAANTAIPPGFQGRSVLDKVRKSTEYDAVAISECVAGSTNPFHTTNRMGPRILSAREQRYKLVLHFNPRQERLFDLEADPGEQAPLSASQQKPVRRRLLEIAQNHLLRPVDNRGRLQAQLREFQLEWSTSPDKKLPFAT